MPWLKIDDVFEEHEKVKLLSDAAHRLWMRAACWSQKTGSKGYVPRGMLESIAQKSAPVRRLEALANELVMARAGGVYASGLWEVVDGGWRFHDWADYQPDPVAPKMTRTEAASAAGKASAKARAELYGTSQPVRHASPPNDLTTFEQRSTNDVHRTEVEPTEPPDPDPDPDLKISSLEVGSKDLPGSRRDVPPPPREPVRVPAAARRIRATDDLMTCPIRELAGRCRANRFDASLAPIGERAELVQVNSAWAKAVGLTTRPLGVYSDGNRPLKTLLEAFETTTLEQLLRVCSLAENDDWCQGTKGSDRDPARKRDIGCLSKSVIDRMLIACDVADAKRAKRDARRAAEAESERRAREEDESRVRGPRPVPVDIETLFATVPSTGFTLSPPRRPRIETTPGTYRPLTAEEIDRALEEGQPANA